MGSYYSISDYTAINPELGTMADFDALVAAAHREGLKVLLDWVPNHTAFDHSWITQHKDWYVTRADGTIVNARDNEGHDTDWTKETARRAKQVILAWPRSPLGLRCRLPRR